MPNYSLYAIFPFHSELCQEEISPVTRYFLFGSQDQVSTCLPVDDEPTSKCPVHLILLRHSCTRLKCTTLQAEDKRTQETWNSCRKISNLIENHCRDFALACKVGRLFYLLTRSCVWSRKICKANKPNQVNCICSYTFAHHKNTVRRIGL